MERVQRKWNRGGGVVELPMVQLTRTYRTSKTSIFTQFYQPDIDTDSNSEYR